MLYHVKARPKRPELSAFKEELTGGTIAEQEPDGREIVASMKRSVIADDRVEWYETCYCTPPLSHERTTVYDKYFSDMEVNPVSSAPRLMGDSFWKHLENIENSNAGSSQTANPLTTVSRYIPITSRMI